MQESYAAPKKNTSAYGVQSTCANPTVYRTKNQNKEILFLLFELIKPWHQQSELDIFIAKDSHPYHFTDHCWQAYGCV